MPINLGQISFGIGADTTRLRQSISDITNFGATVQAAAQAAAGGSNQVVQALMRQEKTAISALQKVQKFQDAVGRLQAPAALTQGFNQLSTRALDQLIARMTQGQLTALQFQREMERFGQTMTNAQRILKNYTEAQRRADADSLISSLRKLSSAAILVAGPLSGIATRLSVIASLSEHFSISWAATIAGVAGGAYAFYNVSKAAIQVEKSLQQVQLSLTAVYGSATIANAQFQYLSDLSDKTGVSFTVLAKQYGQIEAAAKGTNLEGERTKNIFEAIVFAGAKLGLSADNVKGALLAVQQMISKGTISSEELRQQLGDQLPGAMQIMAQAMGVTVQKLGQMMKQSQVGASNLTKFATVLKQRYNIDTSQSLDTITAAEGRLNNARMRALDTLDKQIGFSSAYKNALNFITSGLNGVTDSSSRVVSALGAIAGAFIGAFASTAVITGLSAITVGIRNVTLAIAALDFASLASGGGALLTILAKLGLALAGGVAGYQVMSRAIEGTKQSYLTTLPAIDDYIKSQQNAVSMTQSTTQAYLDQIKTMKSGLEDQLAAKAQEYQDWNEKIQQLRNSGWSDQDIAISETGKQAARVKQQFNDLNEAFNKLGEQKKKLDQILSQQTTLENNAKPDPQKDLTNRQIMAAKRAQEQIRTLNVQYENLFKAPAAKEQAEMLEEVTHKTEQFKEQLERAQVPAGQLKTLVDQYHASLLKLNEGELVLKNQVSAFQALGGVFSRGVDQGLGEFIDVIVDGKDKMEAFGDTVKYVAKDILKTLLQLAALNPLKNFLFGMNSPTLGGSGGIGGFLGKLFSSGTSSTTGSIAVGDYMMPTIGFRSGGIMTSRGSKPLRSYSRGGIANSPQYAEFGEGSMAEAYVPLPDGRSIPVNMKGGMGGVEVHIHEAPGTKVKQSASQSKTGGIRLDVTVQQMVRDTLHSDIASAGPISRSIERQFGLNRAKGLT